MIYTTSAYVVTGRDGPDLDDFISGKLQERDVCGIACHQIAIQHSQNTLVCDNEEIILLSLQFEDDGLQADSNVVV
jgi:hypothetical protein